MDLTTTYMGLTLKNPLVASASPLSEKISNYRRLEDAGAAAIVNYSLFEEEITHEADQLQEYFSYGAESYAEALSYVPEPPTLVTSAEQYVEHIHKAKEAVDIPVIASLNGTSIGGWTRYAQLLQQAGADALELNIYWIPTDPNLTSPSVEESYLEIFRSVKSSVSIPVAVKLSPFFTSLAHLARELDVAGADALVLFNRFYQPDLHPDFLEVVPSVVLSTPTEVRLPLRWIAILFGRVRCSLACTSGVHGVREVLKVLMAGGDVAMLCSVLLKQGIDAVSRILEELLDWMDEHEYESVSLMKGSLSQRACPDPSAFERANYIKALRSYHLPQ